MKLVHRYVKELTSVDENLYPESVRSQVDDVLEQWYKSCFRLVRYLGRNASSSART